MYTHANIRVYIYLCIHVCIYIHIYSYTCPFLVRVFIDTHIQKIHVYKYICLFTHKHTHICIHVYECMYIYTCIYKNVCIYIHICIYICIIDQETHVHLYYLPTPVNSIPANNLSKYIASN